MFTAALFTAAKTWGRPECPSTEERIKQMRYRHEGILLSRKKNEMMPCAATWMDSETITLSEASQRERQMPYNITYVEI